MTDDNAAIDGAFHISQWAHTLIADGSERANTIEHFVGTFLIAARYGQGAAESVGLANEVRGLLINDEQNGNMLEALGNGGGTAFEWSDLKHNYQALSWFNAWAHETGYYRTHTWGLDKKGIPFYYRK